MDRYRDSYFSAVADAVGCHEGKGVGPGEVQVRGVGPGGIRASQIAILRLCHYNEGNRALVVGARKRDKQFSVFICFKLLVVDRRRAEVQDRVPGKAAG